MNRHRARENAFLAFFEASFHEGADAFCPEGRAVDEELRTDDFGDGLLALYAGHAAEVDAEIEKWLKGWKVNRLPRTSLALLRLSIAEMLYGEPGMDSVVINEAVELAKKYGADNDFQFINGVLGSVSRSRGTDAAPADETTERPR